MRGQDDIVRLITGKTEAISQKAVMLVMPQEQGQGGYGDDVLPWLISTLSLIKVPRIMAVLENYTATEVW